MDIDDRIYISSMFASRCLGQECGPKRLWWKDQKGKNTDRWNHKCYRNRETEAWPKPRSAKIAYPVAKGENPLDGDHGRTARAGTTR
jgi:hypothetical protein